MRRLTATELKNTADSYRRKADELEADGKTQDATIVRENAAKADKLARRVDKEEEKRWEGRL